VTSAPHLFFHCHVKCRTVRAFVTPPPPPERPSPIRHGASQAAHGAGRAQSGIAYKGWSSTLGVGHQSSSSHQEEASVCVCVCVILLSFNWPVPLGSPLTSSDVEVCAQNRTASEMSETALKPASFWLNMYFDADGLCRWIALVLPYHRLYDDIKNLAQETEAVNTSIGSLNWLKIWSFGRILWRRRWTFEFSNNAPRFVSS
jgi:hypothetical protein